MHPDLAQAVTIKESAKTLVCNELGTVYRALSADATTALGLSPAFVIHDELGAVKGPRSPLFEAMELATAAQADPLSVIISTQAGGDNDLLSVIVDDALAGHDPRTIVSLHSAPPEMDPFSEEAIKAANPAYDCFMNKTEILDMAAAAKRMPSRQAEFERYVLNRRTESSTPFVSPSIWNDCHGDVAPLHELQPLYAGLDLSAVSDLTALVMIGRKDRAWHVHARFWLPEEGLREKAVQDRVPWDMFRDQGYLHVSPGRSVSYEHVSQELHQLFDEYRIAKVAFDRWGFRFLRPALVRAGFTDQLIDEHFVEFGQGTKSMSPAMRDLEQALLEREIVHDNPILTLCISSMIIRLDAAGNRAPDKRKATHRIDGAVAMIMAMAMTPAQQPAFDVRALIG